MKIIYAVCLLFIGIKASDDIKINNLIWEDKPQNALYPMSFKRALNYCNALEHEKSKGWRIPTSNEMMLITETKRIPTIKATFNYSNVGCYWSYTNHKAQSVNFKEATITDSIKYIDQECFVRCVKNIK